MSHPRPDKCPECGSPATKDDGRYFDCESYWLFVPGTLHQSHFCEVQQLRVENAKLREANDSLSKGVIHQAIIGNDGKNKYYSVPEMVADMTRRRAEDAEAENAKLRRILSSIESYIGPPRCSHMSAVQLIIDAARHKWNEVDPR